MTDPLFRHRLALAPLWIADRAASERLGVNARRIGGYRVRCSCGFVTPAYETAGEARAILRSLRSSLVSFDRAVR